LEKNKVEIIHLATTYQTACGLNIYGGTVNVDVDSSSYVGNNNFVNHTTDPDVVTCDACKTTITFKNRLKEIEEENSYEEEE
jgi:hypothetical protein